MQIGGGKARIDLDAERFGLAGQPAADIAERDDVVAVIVHQRRHHEVGQAERAGRPEHQETVVGDRRLERMIVLVAPAGQQPVDADRIDHGARQDMRADLRALLEHDDGKLGVDLLQPDRRGKPGRSGADDHHVEFHAFAFALAHHCLRTACRPNWRICRVGAP